MELMIRKATVEDAHEVASLAIQMWKSHTIEELTEEFYDYISKESSAVFLALSDECAVGFAQCGLRHDYVEGTDSSPVGYLEGIFVVEEYRKRGLARELLENCQKWAKEQGCTEFASDCELTNDDSLKFHLKMGFEEANRIICFTKKLTDTEIWDLYNENRELLGKDHVRGEQLPIDGYHLVVHVWIRNSKGEYLISQRSANRPTYPLMWECVGGSVVKGENSLQGAIREVKEEVGVDLVPEKGQVLFTKTRKMIDGKVFNDIADVWLFDYDGEVDLRNATTDEVAQVAWMDRRQIKELFDANMLVETLEYFFTEVDK